MYIYVYRFSINIIGMTHCVILGFDRDNYTFVRRLSDLEYLIRGELAGHSYLDTRYNDQIRSIIRRHYSNSECSTATMNIEAFAGRSDCRR